MLPLFRDALTFALENNSGTNNEHASYLGFRAALAACFVYVHDLSPGQLGMEFPLSAITNCLESRCQQNVANPIVTLSVLVGVRTTMLCKSTCHQDTYLQIPMHNFIVIEILKEEKVYLLADNRKVMAFLKLLGVQKHNSL